MKTIYFIRIFSKLWGALWSPEALLRYNAQIERAHSKISLVMEKISFSSVFNSLFMVILLDKFICQIVGGISKESWNITEWLINYQGGFVRRGLMGEVIFNFYYYLGLSPYIAILFLSILAYIVLLIFFVKHFLKNRYPLFILLYPFFLGGPIISFFWPRKDIFIILIFILIVYLAIRDHQYSRESENNVLKLFSFVHINIVFSFGILIHEELGFMGFPILLLIFFGKERRPLIQSVLISLIKLSPSIATFFLCLYYKGSPTASNHIWTSWEPINFPFQDINNVSIPAAIDALSWSLKQGLSFTLNSIFINFNDGIYAPIAWFIIILLIYYVLTNATPLPKFVNVREAPSSAKILDNMAISKFTKTNISKTLIFQLLSFIPLFILGIDYGRWVFLWVTSSFAVIILIPNEHLTILYPKFITVLRNRIESYLSFILGIKSQDRNNIVYIILLVLGVPSYSWSMPFYLLTTPIIIALIYISNLIHIFGSWIISVIS